jgi:hypothetical protein
VIVDLVLPHLCVDRILGIAAGPVVDIWAARAKYLGRLEICGRWRGRLLTMVQAGFGIAHARLIGRGF